MIRALIVLLALASIAHAQSSTSGAIQGVVTDTKTGDKIAGVTIVVSSPVLGPSQTQSTFTDDNGAYKLVDLPPGVYLVTFYLADLQIQVTDVYVGVNQVTPLYQKIDQSAGGGPPIVQHARPPLNPTAPPPDPRREFAPAHVPNAPQPVTRVLADANRAAAAGMWNDVVQAVEPLFKPPGPLPAIQLSIADATEAHRLLGLAYFFLGRRDVAEQHFMAYLRLDLDARLDPALVPPEAVTFFEDIRARHAAELRAMRPKPKPKRSLVLELLPPFGQIQNGETTKAWVLGGMLGTFAIANLGSFALLRSWCSTKDDTCDQNGNHVASARTMRMINLTSGAALIITYLYGVYDGVTVGRRQLMAPYATPSNDGGIVGVAGSF